MPEIRHLSGDVGWGTGTMNEKAVIAYAALMEEVKYRNETIDTFLSGGHKLRAQVVEESCFLQLRMICQVIAIGCLVIHGDVPAVTSALRKSYKADWIMSQMAKIHPQFFPEPLEDNDLVVGTDLPRMVQKQTGFLTQSELGQLWQRAGDTLHRGNAKALLREADRLLRFNEIRSYRNKVVALLTRHTLVSPDEQTLIHIVMNNQGSGKVGWNIMKDVGPAD